MFNPPHIPGIQSRSVRLCTPPAKPAKTPPPSPPRRPSFWQRFAAACRAFRGIEQPAAASAPSGGGLVIVRARYGGADRQFRLIGRRGGHAIASSCDGGSTIMAMLLPGSVHVQDFDAFAAFMNRSGEPLASIPPDAVEADD